MCDGAGYQGDIVVTLQLADKNSVCCKVFQHIRQMRPVWPGRGSCSSSPHKCHQTWNASMRLHPEALWSVPIDENSNLACHIILLDLSNWPIRAFFVFYSHVVAQSHSKTFLDRYSPTDHSVSGGTLRNHQRPWEPLQERGAAGTWGIGSQWNQA